MHWEEPGYVFRRCASCFFWPLQHLELAGHRCSRESPAVLIQQRDWLESEWTISGQSICGFWNMLYSDSSWHIMDAKPLKASHLNNDHVVSAVGVGWVPACPHCRELELQTRCWVDRRGEGPHVVNMVKTALRLRCRHIDSASYYVSLCIKEINDISGDW